MLSHLNTTASAASGDRTPCCSGIVLVISSLVREACSPLEYRGRREPWEALGPVFVASAHNWLRSHLEQLRELQRRVEPEESKYGLLDAHRDRLQP